MEGKGKGGSRGDDMEEPGESVTASKGEGINSKEEGDKGRSVKGREMKAVLGEEGTGGGKKGVRDGGERQAMAKSVKGIPQAGAEGTKPVGMWTVPESGGAEGKVVREEGCLGIF